MKAETGIGFSTAKSEMDSSYQSTQANQLTAGGNINLKSTEGDILAQNTQMQAGKTISLDAAQNIVLEAGQSQSKLDASNQNMGASVGVGVSVGAQTGAYVYGEVGFGKGSQHSNSTTHASTQLVADNIVLKSGGDTTLIGASAHANRIDANVGGALIIESLQDQVHQDSKQTGAGGRVQASFGTAWEASGNFSQEKATGDMNAVQQQSGLFAGDGGYHVKADTVDLKGGAIVSTASKEHNDLTANSLTFTDLNNEMDYKASSVNMSGGGNWGTGDVPVTPGLNSPTPVLPGLDKGSDSSTTHSVLSEGNITIGGKETTAADLGIHTDAATAHNTIDAIPDLDKLLANQKIVAQSIATISSTVKQISTDIVKNAEAERDQAKHRLDQALLSGNQGEINAAKNALSDAQQSVDDWGIGGSKRRALDAMTGAITGGLGGQGLGQVAGNSLSPYAAEVIGNTFSDKGSHPNASAHLMSHAILGAALAYANGGNLAAGAASGAGSEALAPVLIGFLYGDKPINELTSTEKQLVSDIITLAGSGIGGAVGGTGKDVVIGGAVGQNAVENNYLTKNNWDKYKKQVGECKDFRCIKKAQEDLYRESEKNNQKLRAACSEDGDFKICQSLVKEVKIAKENSKHELAAFGEGNPKKPLPVFVNYLDIPWSEAPSIHYWAGSAVIPLSKGLSVSLDIAVNNVTGEAFVGSTYLVSTPDGSGGASGSIKVGNINNLTDLERAKLGRSIDNFLVGESKNITACSALFLCGGGTQNSEKGKDQRTAFEMGVGQGVSIGKSQMIKFKDLEIWK